MPVPCSWISIEVEKPPKNVPVLAYDKKQKRQVAIWDGKQFKTETHTPECSIVLDSVTHWTFLPILPAEYVLDVAIDTIKEFITKGKFSKEELLTAIQARGGLPRIRYAYTVQDYLSDLVYEGKLKYIPAEQCYEVVT